MINEQSSQLEVECRTAMNQADDLIRETKNAIGEETMNELNMEKISNLHSNIYRHI